MIKKIAVKQIRGIKDREFRFNIIPNKPNLFVAPNGFGKSSLATAFNSMKKTGLRLEDNDLYNHDFSTKPQVIIELSSGETFVANKSKNEILNEFSVQVINSQLYPKAVTKNLGKFSSTSADICVKTTTIFGTIPEKVEFSYSITQMKKDFGTVGKILTNLRYYLEEPSFTKRIYSFKEDLKKLTRVRNTKKINLFIDGLQRNKGTKRELINNTYDFSSLDEIEEFVKLLKFISNINQVENPTIREYLDTIQLIKIYTQNYKKIYKIYKYCDFIKIKEELDDLLSSMNTSWKDIKTKKTGNSLVLELPPASEISNGERDILSFIAKLYEAKSKFIKNKSILIIDEIFDYLDDSNLITAQYYINQIIKDSKENGKEIYPIILTHLDPQYFKTYSFSLKNVHYLDVSVNNINKYNINNAIKNRNKIPSLSSHFLHYNPEEITEGLFSNYGISDDINNSKEFYDVVKRELELYIQSKNYDVILVCTGLRIHIERSVYNLLENELKNAFLEEHGTSNKLDYATNHGIDIPDIFYMLGIIYNEALHLDAQCKKIISVGHKLNNNVIKKMISDVVSNKIGPSTYSA